MNHSMTLHNIDMRNCKHNDCIYFLYYSMNNSSYSIIHICFTCMYIYTYMYMSGTHIYTHTWGVDLWFCCLDMKCPTQLHVFELLLAH